MPIVRAMVLEFQDDPAIYDKDFQYMFGEELLVAPAFDNEETTKDVYLPRGKWLDYWTGESYKGPQNISYRAALDKLPLFVKAGAIIPMQPDMNYVGEKPVDPLTLDIYPFETSSFTLYEDDGETEDYKKGDFALTTFVCIEREDGVIIDIGESKGQCEGKLKSRGYVLKVNQVSAPDRVIADGRTLKQCTSHSQFEKKRIGWYYDNTKRILRVKLSAVNANDRARIHIEGAKVI